MWGSDMARMGWVLCNAGVNQCWMLGSGMARMGWVLCNAGVNQCWMLGSGMARMGWVLGNAGCGVLIWTERVGCWVMLDVGF